MIGGRQEVAGAELDKGRLEVPGVAVVPGVVGHDPGEADAALSEEGGGTTKEGGTAGAELIGHDLAVRQTGVVVDQGVNEVVAEPAGNTGAAPSAMDVVAPTWRNAAQLLDVDVTEIARVRVLVPADDTTGGPVKPIEAVKSVTTQHGIAGGARLAGKTR